MNPTTIVELSVNPDISGTDFDGLVKKVLLEVEVACPGSDCEQAEVTRVSTSEEENGTETLYQCSCCGKQFTWTGSRFFVLGRSCALMEVTEACVGEGRTETALAKEIGVCQPHISRLVTSTTQAVATKEPHLQAEVQTSATQKLANQGSYPVISTDESFIKALGKTYFPTWSVDQEGNLVHFEWLESRSEERIGVYLASQRAVSGPTAIQLHDGLAAYHACFTAAMGEPIEIVHIHRAPKGRVVVLGRERTPVCNCSALHVVGLHTRNLHGPGPAVGWYAVKISRCDEHACQCRKELCLEGDHLYLCQACMERPEQVQLEHLWQFNRPQEVYQKGLMFTWERPPYQGGLPFIPFCQFEALPGKLSGWSHSWAQTLLAVLYQAFPACCPTTNRIERQHGRFKDHHEWRGHRSPHHVKAWFLTWIALDTCREWFKGVLAKITRRINPRVILWAVLKRLFPRLTLQKPVQNEKRTEKPQSKSE